MRRFRRANAEDRVGIRDRFSNLAYDFRDVRDRIRERGSSIRTSLRGATIGKAAVIALVVLDAALLIGHSHPRPPPPTGRGAAGVRRQGSRGTTTPFHMKPFVTHGKPVPPAKTHL